MGIAARRDGASTADALLARLRAGAAGPELARLDELALIRATDRGATLRGRRRGEDWSVVLKTYAGADAAARAERLHAQHRAAYDRCAADPRMRVPEPLAGFADPPGYAMRHVPGRAASAIAKWTLVSRARARAELLARAARWLHAFHRPGEPERFAPGFLLRELEARLQAPDRAGEIPHPGELGALLDLLRRTAARLPEACFPKGPVHGDFNLHNLIIDGDVTWSIDFAGGPDTRRPVSFDVACCLFFLEFRDGWRAADRRGTPGGFDRAAIEVFAAGYPGLPWSSPEAAWLLLHHQLRQWTSLPRLNMLAQTDTMRAMCRHAAETLAARTA